MEDTVFVMVQRLYLNGTYIGGWMGCPIRSSQSKGTLLGLGERAFGGRINLSHSKGVGLGMLMIWLKDTFLSSRRVGLTRDSTGVATSSIIGWRGCVVTGARDASPLTKGVRSGEYCVSGTTETIKGEVVKRNHICLKIWRALGWAPRFWYLDSNQTQTSKVTYFTSLAKEFRLTSEASGLLNVISRKKRVFSCIMNRSGRRDMAMIRGKNNGVPNIIGRGCGQVVDVVCRRSRPISNMSGRGWRWSTNMIDSDWASDRW